MIESRGKEAYLEEVDNCRHVRKGESVAPLSVCFLVTMRESTKLHTYSSTMKLGLTLDPANHGLKLLNP